MKKIALLIFAFLLNQASCFAEASVDLYFTNGLVILNEGTNRISFPKEYENFDLSVDVLTKNKAQGSISFHQKGNINLFDNLIGGYSVVINNENGDDNWWRKTGRLL